MFYLGKGKKGLMYLALIITFTAVYYGTFPVNSLHTIINVLLIIITIIGIVHCFRIASKGEQDTSKWYAHWYAILLILIIPNIAAVGFRTFYYAPYHVPSSSMSPNVNLGDYLFAEKRPYGAGKMPQRGDIIIFKNPKDGKDFIKRIIGLPGDKIEIKHAILYINDKEVVRKRIEDFNYQVTQHPEKAIKDMPQYLETTPEGKEYRILNELTDGPLDNTPVYLVPEHSYFVLGDNRDRSADSRMPDKVGFIPEENIIGKVAVVLWNSYTYKFTYRPE